MTRAEEKYFNLKAEIYRWLNDNDYQVAKEAMALANGYHTGMRKDGITPEFSHQLEIVMYLRGLMFASDLDIDLIAAVAFLHDLLEDTDYDYDKLLEQFGEDVAEPVMLLSKKYKGEARYPSLHEYFDAIAEDDFAIIVKCADRIHNLKTMIGVFSLEKQIKYIDETELYILPALKKAYADGLLEDQIYWNLRLTLEMQIEMTLKFHEELKK